MSNSPTIAEVELADGEISSGPVDGEVPSETSQSPETLSSTPEFLDETAETAEKIQAALDVDKETFLPRIQTEVLSRYSELSANAILLSLQKLSGASSEIPTNKIPAFIQENIISPLITIGILNGADFSKNTSELRDLLDENRILNDSLEKEQPALSKQLKKNEGKIDISCHRMTQRILKLINKMSSKKIKHGDPLQNLPLGKGNLGNSDTNRITTYLPEYGTVRLLATDMDPDSEGNLQHSSVIQEVHIDDVMTPEIQAKQSDAGSRFLDQLKLGLTTLDEPIITDTDTEEVSA